MKKNVYIAFYEFALCRTHQLFKKLFLTFTVSSKLSELNRNSQLKDFSENTTAEET
jgi:hypothetical protein